MSSENIEATRLSMDVHSKIRREHLDRAAYIYVRQSSFYQVTHNLESGRRQYERVQWAVAAGWPKEKIVLVDDDQGVTATLPKSRPGFARLVATLARGEIGIVISLEGARLARNGPDWSQLLFLCRWTDTLIADEHGVYDMAVSSDRMVLGIRGQVSELEIDTSIHRLVAARWSKAERGELITVPPAGYDIDEWGQLVMTRDESVAEALRTVFEKFDELGTARQVWLWWQDQGLKFPVRRIEGRTHPVVWKTPMYRMILSTLHHPIYAGAYVFGRSQTVRRLDPEDPTKLVVSRPQRKKWPILIQDHHEAYIGWERYLVIQERIRGNRAMIASDENHQGPAREGRALLQGLIRCGDCGRRMYVGFGGTATGAKGRTPQYRCMRRRQAMGGKDCQIMGSQRVDAVVVEAFLAATEPATIEVALEVEELARQDRAALTRVWQLQIEKAEYEAQRAERQYQAVEPENRMVARTLERLWNERLEAVQEIRTQAAAALEQPPPLSEAQWERIQRLAKDLESVWTAATTTDRDRKRLLRCLIEEIQLRTEEKRYHIKIVWKGGATTEREVARRSPGKGHATAEDTVELVRRLATEFDDAQIARILNKQGRRTGLGNPFTKARLLSLRGHYHIPMCPKRPAQDPLEGPFTADEAADELGVRSSTIHRWLRDGLLAGEQATSGAPWRIALTEDVRRRLSGGEAPPGWVGLTEAARRLGLSKSHVAYLVNSGKLEAMRVPVGKRVCWRINVDSATCGLQPELFDQMRNDASKEA